MVLEKIDKIEEKLDNKLDKSEFYKVLGLMATVILIFASFSMQQPKEIKCPTNVRSVLMELQNLGGILSTMLLSCIAEDVIEEQLFCQMIRQKYINLLKGWILLPFFAFLKLFDSFLT